MNPGAIHLALIYAAVAVLATIGCLLAYAGERSRDIDEHTDWHSERPGRPCPWCEAADPQRIEHERQQHRAQIAKEHREAAERRMRGAV